MTASYDDLRAIRESNPGWRLLRADNAPLLVAFLHRVFIAANRRTMTLADLIEALEDDLHLIRQVHGADSLPRRAHEYIDDWKSANRGWLRVTYNSDDEPQAALTSDAESAVNWVIGLTTRSFVGTESRLLTLFELLRQMVQGSETDPESRIADLERQRDQLNDEIERVRAGSFGIMDDAALKDRFSQFQRSSREFLSDLRQLEENFQQLGRQVREQIVRHEGAKGELLEQYFTEQDIIKDSDEGKSFQAFWELLLSPTRKEELAAMLSRVMELPAVNELDPDPRTARVHFDWHDAGDHTQRTVQDLSAQLRAFLEDDAQLENRRIMQLLTTIQEHALTLRDHAPATFGRSNVTELDDLKAAITLPMERKLHTLPISQDMPTVVEDVDLNAVDTTALFDHHVVDHTKLADNVATVLRERTSTTLTEVLTRFPLELGLAEVVGYFHIADASQRFDSTIDESQHPATYWTAGDPGQRIVRRIWRPEVIFVRISDKTHTNQPENPDERIN